MGIDRQNKQLNAVQKPCKSRQLHDSQNAYHNKKRDALISCAALQNYLILSEI